MMQIRKFEDGIMDLLTRNIAQGGSHLSAGQEAVPVGAMAAIRKDDTITSTHRGHGHCIAKAVSATGKASLDVFMAEILGKETGCCRGKGGSLHLADVATGNLGANGVVGGGLGMATGAALAVRMQKKDNVVICFFGDGALNEGIFHECANMAATWNLPILFLVENNLYGMSVAVTRASNLMPDELHIRAQAYKMPGKTMDGQNVLDVRDNVAEMIAPMREGMGPALLICSTYRYYGHSRSDPRAYRTRDEEDYWKKRDPITLFSDYARKHKLLTKKDIDRIDSQTTKEMEKAVKFAMESPDPEPSELYTDLFAPPFEAGEEKEEWLAAAAVTR
jgi:TPP-dependent pyruvate/acetoin dehydrogenase alpha subunit